MIEPIFWYKHMDKEEWIIYRAENFDYMGKDVSWMNDEFGDRVFEADIDFVNWREIVYSEEQCLKRVAELWAAQLNILNIDFLINKETQ